MKKLQLFTLLFLVLALILSGCGEKTKEEHTPEQQETQQDNNTQEQNVEENNDATPSLPTQSYQDSLSDRIPFTVDIGPGWETFDIAPNGIHRRIAITFEMESSEIDKDPCLSYYRAEVLGEDMYAELVAVGRVYLPDTVVDYLKEKRAEDDLDGAWFQMFEYDFKAYAFKGKDKDYIVFTVPASWDPNPSSSMVITTADGKLLADFEVNKTYQVTLQGDDTQRYMDYEGNTNFFSFNEDSITYLQVSQRSDGVTYLTEYSLNIDNDEITSVETGKIYQTTDTVPDIAGISIR